MVDVYLSPSVQDQNIGYGDYLSEEFRMNLVADVVGYELDRHGVTYVRNSPNMTLTEVVRDSNRINPKAHVAIHSNASASGLARGPAVYTYRFGGKGEELSRDIYNELVKITPEVGFGVLEGDTAFGGRGYYELRRTVAPASLVEVSFHDNPEDAQFIIDNIYELGVAISKGILDFLGVNYTPDSEENINFLKSKYNSYRPSSPVL